MAGKPCGEVIHWRQVAGMLLRAEDGYFDGRCPRSGRSIRQKKRPLPGGKCGLPEDVCCPLERKTKAGKKSK